MCSCLVSQTSCSRQAFGRSPSEVPFTMQLPVFCFFLFCVPREGGGTITSPLLTFAGTDCNVSGSFPISKHISSERHRESNSVYPCKTLLSYNTERWTSAIVSVTNKQDFVWAPVTMWAGESGELTAAATLHNTEE